jgi:hypothetical protein
MAPQTAQESTSGSELSRMMGASSSMSQTAPQHQRRFHLVHRDAAIAATEDMTLDTPLETDFSMRSSKNMKQHAIGCEYIQIEFDSRQLTI